MLFERLFMKNKLLKYTIESVKLTDSNYTMLKIIDFVENSINIFSENYSEFRF